MSTRVSHGDGLYLHNDSSWVFMYKFKGKRTERGLGSIKKISLATAKRTVRGYRVKLDNGIDPFATVEPEGGVLFSVVAHDLIESMRSGWKNEKHGDQWGNTLKHHASTIMAKPVSAITTEDVLAVLQPIWSEIPETASRVRGRIEKVLDAARVRGLRTGENPARWKGHLEMLLPRRTLASRKHHPAMPYDQLPAFVQDLRKRKALSALALELLILTAARSNEIRNADWAGCCARFGISETARRRRGRQLRTAELNLELERKLAMTTISMAKLRDHVEAKKREIGWVDDDASTDALRNKGGNRSPEKCAFLARVDARAIAAGKKPTRSYY